MEAILQKTSLRQAAVLMRSLDASAAASLLACLSNDEAQAVRAAMRELDEVTDDERQGVVEALSQQATKTESIVDPPVASQAYGDQGHGGVELQLGSAARSTETYSLAPAIAPSSLPLPTAAAMETSPGVAPNHLEPSTLDSLSEVDCATLVAYVKEEQPQTVAVVLSLIAPEKAAAVLAALPASLQDAAIGRLAFLSDADDACIEVIEADLKQWIIARREEARRQEDRMTSVRAILHAANDDTRQRLVAGLETRGVSWASAIAAASATPETPAVKMAPAQEESLPGDLADLIRLVDQESADESKQTAAESEAFRLESEEPTIIKFAQPEPPTASLPESEPEPTLAFDALEYLSLGSLAYVIKHADPQQFVFAMVGASKGMLRRVESLATRKQVKLLRKQIKEVGPLRINQIEQAQTELARLAEKMIRKGQIHVGS